MVRLGKALLKMAFSLISATLFRHNQTRYFCMIFCLVTVFLWARSKCENFRKRSGTFAAQVNIRSLFSCAFAGFANN